MTPRVRLAVAALTTVLVGCGPAIHGPARTVPVAYAEPRSDAITFWGHACAYIDVGGSLEARGIPRFAGIEPGLARGGQPSEEGIRYLRERGYRTVISFRRNPAERRLVERMGIGYVEIPMHAGLFGASPPTERDVELFLSVVSDSSRRPVFFHCRRGKDRTGAMAAIYRIEACGWTNEEAVEEMKAFGFSRHYRKLMRYVRTYVRGSLRAG